MIRSVDKDDRRGLVSKRRVPLGCAFIFWAEGGGVGEDRGAAEEDGAGAEERVEEYCGTLFLAYSKTDVMPWYNGDYPPSYKNQPVEIRNKATEIANELLLHGAPEGVAIATGLKKARQLVKVQKPVKGKKGRVRK